MTELVGSPDFEDHAKVEIDQGRQRNCSRGDHFVPIATELDISRVLHEFSGPKIRVSAVVDQTELEETRELQTDRCENHHEHELERGVAMTEMGSKRLNVNIAC